MTTLNQILEDQIFLSSDPSVEEFLLDIESPMWRAAASIFPDVRVRGCGFQWNQAERRKLG